MVFGLSGGMRGAVNICPRSRCLRLGWWWDSGHGRVYREESSGGGCGGSRVVYACSGSIARRPEGRAHLVAAVRVEAGDAGADGHCQVGELPGRCQDRSSPTAGAEVSESLLFASNGEPIEALEVSGLHGNRIHKFQAPADNLQVSYTATIVGKTDRAPVTDYDLTMYLWPNR